MRRLLPLALLLLAAAAPLATLPLSRMDLPWWRQRFVQKQAELRHGPVDLVWYGDSITEDWEFAGPPPWMDYLPIWQRFYGGRHAVNLGFMGDATCHLLWRIENGEAEGIHPKAAVVLIGANNFGRLHWPAGPTFEGIEKIVAELNRRLPGTHVLLISVLPSLRGAWADQQVAEVNRLLAARYADGREARFVDVTGIFMKDGKVDPTRFRDPLMTPPEPPLHPSPAAQEKIAEAIEPVLSRMLGDRNRLTP